MQDDTQYKIDQERIMMRFVLLHAFRLLSTWWIKVKVGCKCKSHDVVGRLRMHGEVRLCLQLTAVATRHDARQSRALLWAALSSWPRYALSLLHP